MKSKKSVTIEESNIEFLTLKGNGNLSKGIETALEERDEALHFAEQVIDTLNPNVYGLDANDPNDAVKILKLIKSYQEKLIKRIDN